MFSKVFEVKQIMEVIEIDDDDLMELSVPIHNNDDDDLMMGIARTNQSMNLNVHKEAITHVVWPRKLPSKKSDISEHEIVLIALMTDIADHFESRLTAFSGCARLFRSMYNTRLSNHPEVVAVEINRLRDGEMFGYFVKEQNCGISVHMVPSEHNVNERPKLATVSIFPVEIPNEEMYVVKHSDFQVEFPSRSVMVENSEMLNSIEFSKQLVHLSRHRTALSGCGAYVSQWLLPMLSKSENVVLRQTTFPIISKKIRDDVLGMKQNAESFRRCSYWTFLKAILQFYLTIEFGETTGKVIYKLMLLRFMAILCNFYNTQMYTTLKVDVVSHMLAKLARRIEKVKNLLSWLDEGHPNKFDGLPDGFETIYNEVIDEVKLVIYKCREKLDRQISELQIDDESKCQLQPLLHLDFESDVTQKLPNLRKYLDSRLYPPVLNENGATLKIKSYSRHFVDSRDPLDVKVFDRLKNPVEIGIFLSDFENWILYTLFRTSDCDPVVLRSYSLAYARLATQYYKNDPLAFSRVVLTQIKILTLLEKIAIDEHKMLTKHRAGINPNIFDKLLLPHYLDFEIAHDFKKYYTKRSTLPSYPSLLEEEQVTAHSFSVRFAKKNEEMQKLLQHIHQIKSEAIKKAKEEWRNRRREVDALRAKLATLDCEYIVNSNRKREHKNTCASCKLEAKIRNIRVGTYESPLPECVDQQNAIVFELRIPIEIACLRDVLHEVLLLLNEVPKKTRIFEKWIQCSTLEEFNQSESKRVFLGTSIKGTPVGRTRTRGVHPDQPFESCMVENDRNCLFYGKIEEGTHRIPNATKNQSPSKRGSLCVEPGSPYESLQWTIIGTEHTQNQVIASQFLCPQNLTICEYKNFGSLRADGHRLQLRKLYAMLETESLSFETQSVLALITQTIWEVGPSNPLSVNWNESHEDYADPKFAAATIELIDKFINTQKSNWKHPLKLVMSSLIAVRVFEMNEDNDVADRTIQLLSKLRDIAYDWIEKVQTAIHETGTKADEEKLRQNLVEIAIAGALTFFVHFRHQYFDKIFIGSIVQSITSVRFWFEFLVTLNGNMLLRSKNQHGNSSYKFTRMFRGLIQRTAVQIEPKIREIVAHDPSDVFEFIKSQWGPSKTAILQLKLNNNHPETIIVSATINDVEHFIQIGIVTGEFLVDNLPVSRLPKLITQNPLFERVFENYLFDVHKDASGTFTTKHSYKQSYYKFHCNDGNDIIITEQKTNGDEYELIPEKHFNEEVPYLLINNYSHWWCKSKKIIEFRPIRFSDPNISSSEGVQYELDLDSRKLVHRKTQKIMLDVTSESFTKIVDQLARLESRKYIHIFMEHPKVAKVDVVRMNIKFIVDASNEQDSYDVISNEFNGMRISMEQNCGTLYGLRKGLLLESGPRERIEQKKLVIMPHGNVTARISGVHETVDIDVETDLRSPSFFIYQIDSVCQQLKASNRSYSAWFYLAYLHALTSHGMPEPFTNLTGTERAFQILQSAFAWSTAPYDKEAITTLKLIEKLAPHRSIRNNLMWTRWPDIVETHAAQDGFLFITNQLIIDSNRLNELYSKNDQTLPVTEKRLSQNAETELEMDASIREYFRNLPFFPNLRLCPTIMQHMIVIASHYVHIDKDPALVTIRTISNAHFMQKFVAPKSFKLTQFLCESSEEELQGHEKVDNEDEILTLFSMKSLRNKWLTLYNIARSAQFSREKFALLLGLLAFQNNEKNDLNAILLLQTVAENRDLFDGIDPPNVMIFHLKYRYLRYKSIERVLEQYHTPPDNRGTYNETREIRYTLAVREYIHKIVKKIENMLPCDEVHPSILQHTHPDVNLRDAVVSINRMLRRRRNVERLIEFLELIELQIHRLASFHINDASPMDWIPEKLPIKHLPKFYVDFEAKFLENLPMFEAEVLFAEQILYDPAKLAMKDWWLVYKSIVTPFNMQHLYDSGMYPRVVLNLVLPKLLSSTQNPKLKSIICAVGMQIVHQQREQRIQLYSEKPEMKAALEQELQNEPHTNWSPYEYPEWLLFEIEQDLTIRPIQIEVAKRMINPPEIGTKHSVMQLNMGEGKTAVIVPILAAILANGQQVCQVTVLKSLFATNLKELRQCLGGMLNRRIYTFPCRRDMPINKYAEKMLDIHIECRLLKGVVLTLPEYRLSFQLKIYEAPGKDEMECAAVLLEIHNWLNQNVRNILDESDAILQPKYQLIYTLGEQRSLDGGAQRWTTIQAILKQLPRHFKKLWERFGDDKIEFDVKSNHTFGTQATPFRFDVFTSCRILDNPVYEILKSNVIEEFVDGHLSGISHSTKKKLKLLLNDGDVSTNYYNEVMENLTTSQQTTVLILSGLFRFNILQLVLNKRWRVNYGVNESGPRKMAIPFKAKDVAAEMTEFGHPDVAICLTQLSYYYSGLNEAQLHQVFKILESQQNSSEIYEKWIRSVPRELINETIQTYTGVNLSDPKQRNELVFPLFKYNMHVIDYWLSNIVYPREAKTFESKLMCTAWDLVSDNLTRTVSGFSGTNDTKNILPLPIMQNDLKELEQTNDNVRKILLLPENSGYHALPANVRGLQILIELKKKEIPVLLDSGACMLELNNEQLATQWLKLVDETLFDATVYFNSNDVLMTVDRNGIFTEFDYSVYRNKLDRCLVYLDDVHTRGTDLKFPLGWKACVTLSGEITRDKTVQACMRMRLLGKGHSILFMATFEADIRMREYCGLGNATPTSENVIKFICNNSRRFEEDNTAHWASAAINYTKKLVAHKLSENLQKNEACSLLHMKCKDNEYVTLKDMYGVKESALLTQISKNQFEKMINSCRLNDEILEMVKSVADGVSTKLSTQVPRLERFTQSFEEEQEKELEHELEEQRHVERPPPAKAVTPVFNELLNNIIRSGATSQSFRKIQMTKCVMTLDESLLKKPLYAAHKDDPSPWLNNLYVTRDFMNVVKNDNSEDYLRPVWWIARIFHREGEDIFLLLSSFEADLLLPLFRKSDRAILMSYRPRLSQLHSNLLHDTHLRVSNFNMNPDDLIGLDEEVQISMYSGSMYFKNASEQNAYCSFMGLIPNPRTSEIQKAFEDGFIDPNAFVPVENRQYTAVIAQL
ncbi:hypothetical protein Bhyg_14413, partial [Pseudolycoriella hygida]